MPELDDLHRLAPSIDHDAAVAIFRRRRSRDRLVRRAALGLAAGALLVVGSIVMVASLREDGEAVVAGPSQDGASVGFKVLSVAEAVDDMGTLRAATDRPEFDALWAQSGSDQVPPQIDFDTVVVVSITIPDDACPPELTAFQRELDTITPVFLEPQGGCVEPLIPKTYVVALSRTSFDTRFTLRLPGQNTYGFGEQRLEVQLGASPTNTVSSAPVVVEPEPTCAQIERFAEQLVDVGIAYDYEPSESPEALFADADVVLLGTLTGGFQSQQDPDRSRAGAGYEVEVNAVYKSPPNIRLANRLVVWVDYNPSYPTAAYEEAIAAGAPVVVFTYDSETRPGFELSASIEGFATACPGGRPIGFVGGGDSWASLRTLDDLAARLELVAANG